MFQQPPVGTSRVGRGEELVQPLGADGDPAVLVAASAALVGIRRAKTEAKASQKTPVARLALTADPVTVDLIRRAEGDLRAVGRIAQLDLSTDEQRSVGFTIDAVELADGEA